MKVPSLAGGWPFGLIAGLMLLPCAAGAQDRNAWLLAACDALGRWAAAPLEMPVGALTAVLGGPVFLWLLARRD